MWMKPSRHSSRPEVRPRPDTPGRPWRGPLCLLLVLTLPAGAAHAAGSLKLSTWNLDWLTVRAQGDAALPADVMPRTTGEMDRLAQYAHALAPDIAALEEIDSADLAARLFPAPAYHIIISGDQVVQKVAVAIRSGLQIERYPDVTALDVYPPDAPRHLRSGLDLSVGTGADRLRLLVVHLKAGCRDSGPRERKPACRTLLRQMAVIQDWIMERQDEGEAFAVLGDFNRLLAPDDPALRTLAENGPLTLATADHASPCAQGSYFIDHIILGGAARGWLQPDSLRVMLYRADAATTRLSDHCPVSVRLMLP